MNILAIDCGTKTGWAVKIGDKIESGIQEFTLKRGESPGMRFIRFRVWLGTMIRDIKPALVVYEEAHHRGGAATNFLVGLTTRVVEICAENGVDHEPVHSTTLKKHATGSGRAEKGDMIIAANKRWGREDVDDDNEADALCLLSWALEEYGGGL